MRDIRTSWRLFALSFLVATLSSCVAPGMKLNVTPDGEEKEEKIGEMRVTLRSINPAVVINQGKRQLDTTGLGELLQTNGEAYRLGPQDIILVTAWEHPELTQPLGQYRTDAATGQVIDNEGYFFFPYAGKVMVKGLTTGEVREMLTTILSKVLQNPQVDVKVTSYRSQKVFISGEVKAPGVYPITDVPMTIAEAVGRAGGFTPISDASRLLLTRNDHTYLLDFQRLMNSPGNFSKLQMRDGDILHVSSRDEEKVYLLGELRSPKALALYNGKLSLAQAISEAGGLESLTANAHAVYVIRSGIADDQVDVFHLDARNPTALVLADKFDLRPRDIVYVDAVGLAHWNRMISLLLPTVTLIRTGTDIAVDAKTLSK